MSKPEAVKECQNNSNQIIGIKLDLDCEKIMNHILIIEAFEILTVEII